MTQIKTYIRGFPTRMVYLCNDIEGFRPEWCISAMISRVSDQNGISPAMISRVSDQNGISRLYNSRVSDQNGISVQRYRGFPTRMVYLDFLSL